MGRFLVEWKEEGNFLLFLIIQEVINHRKQINFPTSECYAMKEEIYFPYFFCQVLGNGKLRHQCSVQFASEMFVVEWKVPNSRTSEMVKPNLETRKKFSGHILQSGNENCFNFIRKKGNLSRSLFNHSITVGKLKTLFVLYIYISTLS